MNSSPHKAADLELLYKNKFDAMTDYRVAVWKILVSEYFNRWIPANAHVLDIGCGYCEFINNVKAARKFGIDLNPRAKQNAAEDVTLFLQDCSAHWPITDESLDTVFTSNFFEHVPSKSVLEETIKQAFRCLKPGGRLIAMGPNIKYEPGKYWDNFDHYIALTEISLAEAFAICGFEMEAEIGRFVPYTMSNAKAAQKPLWMLQLYLKMPWVWPIFGRQFLVVARKPGA